MTSSIQNNMDNQIAKIYKSSKTIFSNKDLALLWQENNANNLKAKSSYYARKNILLKLTRGVFAKDQNYDAKELATSIYSPSYISFETVLREAGIIFQHYDTVFVASRWSRDLKINKTNLSFRKLKDIVLYNTSGIRLEENYSIASPERAFLDMMYLFPDYYFDNLDSINWDRCDEIVKIYNNKQLIKRLIKYRKNYVK